MVGNTSLFFVPKASSWPVSRQVIGRLTNWSLRWSTRPVNCTSVSSVSRTGTMCPVSPFRWSIKTLTMLCPSSARTWTYVKHGGLPSHKSWSSTDSGHTERSAGGSTVIGKNGSLSLGKRKTHSPRATTRSGLYRLACCLSGVLGDQDEHRWSAPFCKAWPPKRSPSIQSEERTKSTTATATREGQRTKESTSPKR